MRRTAADADRWAGLKWSTYAQYFARPALRPLLLQFLFFMLSFSTFISGPEFGSVAATWSCELGELVPIPTLPLGLTLKLSVQVADAFLRAMTKDDPVSDNA